MLFNLLLMRKRDRCKRVNPGTTIKFGPIIQDPASNASSSLSGGWTDSYLYSPFLPGWQLLEVACRGSSIAPGEGSVPDLLNVRI
jgi:hypothetical protein